MPSERQQSRIRRWLAYAIHPDMSLLRAHDGDCRSVVEQSHNMEFVVQEAIDSVDYDSPEMVHIQKIHSEWDRLKQELGVKYSE